MKKHFKKKIFITAGLFIFLMSSGFFLLQSLTAEAVSNPLFNAEYTPLVTLPGVTNENAMVSFADYVTGAYKFIIGMSFVIAVLMLVIGGFEYMTSEAFSSKEAAKKRIWNAVLGLLIIISAYVILRTINPDLVDFNLDLSLPVQQGGTGGTGGNNPPTCQTSDPQPTTAGYYLKIRQPQTDPKCNPTEYTTWSGDLGSEATCESYKQVAVPPNSPVGTTASCHVMFDSWCFNYEAPYKIYFKPNVIVESGIKKPDPSPKCIGGKTDPYIDCQKYLNGEYLQIKKDVDKKAADIKAENQITFTITQQCTPTHHIEPAP